MRELRYLTDKELMMRALAILLREVLDIDGSIFELAKELEGRVERNAL